MGGKSSSLPDDFRQCRCFARILAGNADGVTERSAAVLIGFCFAGTGGLWRALEI